MGISLNRLSFASSQLLHSLSPPYSLFSCIVPFHSRNMRDVTFEEKGVQTKDVNFKREKFESYHSCMLVTLCCIFCTSTSLKTMIFLGEKGNVKPHTKMPSFRSFLPTCHVAQKIASWVAKDTLYIYLPHSNHN